MIGEPEYVLVGYFRFLPPDECGGERGVVGQVVSAYADGWAHPSDVPVYRRGNETKATMEVGA